MLHTSPLQSSHGAPHDPLAAGSDPHWSDVVSLPDVVGFVLAVSDESVAVVPVVVDVSLPLLGVVSVVSVVIPLVAVSSEPLVGWVVTSVMPEASAVVSVAVVEGSLVDIPTLVVEPVVEPPVDSVVESDVDAWPLASNRQAQQTRPRTTRARIKVPQW
jgi:hypothetical protein